MLGSTDTARPARTPHQGLPEVLAPAGDEAALQAAIDAGADAVYFGVDRFNARARAKNFRASELGLIMRRLHDRGMRGYVALNTLVFDDELETLEASVRSCAEAAADAVIVQDLGVACLVREIAPDMPIHASTQMTCTDLSAIEFARRIGATRIILPRELSLRDIADLRSHTDLDLEVFVHGALCISYSGQCLTSEAIGGRSANRGACAQACRLPYEMVVDGKRRSVGERAYLLSPQDLDATEWVPKLVDLGVAALKIEGRLKGPEYVAATTRLYKKAVLATAGRSDPPSQEDRDRALLAFSRGSGPGFLDGVDHGTLVDGMASDHRGILAGHYLGVCVHNRRRCLQVSLESRLVRGDGVVVEGGFAGAGEAGGRIWAIYADGREVDSAQRGSQVLVWLGPDRQPPPAAPKRRLFRTSGGGRELRAAEGKSETPRPGTMGQEPGAGAHARQTRQAIPVDMHLAGRLGEVPTLSACTADGRRSVMALDARLERAETAPLTEDAIRDKLGRLGGTPFALRRLETDLPVGAILPVSSLNRARRNVVQDLLGAGHRSQRTTSVSWRQLLAQAERPDRPPPPGGVFVLCRNMAQAEAAVAAGATGIYLDFLDLVGLRTAFESLRRNASIPIGVASPRIGKPGEKATTRRFEALGPDLLLVRSLGALEEAGTTGSPSIGDFSLNVTNRLSAGTVLARGLMAFTPAFDLDSDQLLSLLDGPLASYAEVVVHHPMPLFHMAHCLFAARLSTGHDFRDCGRPCDRHLLSLRDRTGRDHPVFADASCDNTVFHASPQSAARLIPALRARGVRRYRIELLRESAEMAKTIVAAYSRGIDGSSPPDEVLRTLGALPEYEVVRGSLRVLPDSGRT